MIRGGHVLASLLAFSAVALAPLPRPVTIPAMEPKQCELCGRKVAKLTRHHLIPRTRHKNKRNKREFDREDVRHRILMVCTPCQKQIHAFFSEKELERTYNTREALLAHPDLTRFVAWLATKPDGTFVRAFPSRQRKKRDAWRAEH
jgi:hypothetical protein